MARTKKEAAEAVEVRALVDYPELGMSAGRLATIPAEALQWLKSAGWVDDHADAVEAARTTLGA
jgi:hypothetical protein